MGTEQELRRETEKWLLRIEREIKNIKPPGQKGSESLENIKAYIKDSRYFMGRGDLVRAFEAVIWSWAIYDTAKELKLLKVRETKNRKGD